MRANTDKYKQMPKPVTTRSGCKVGWAYYRTEKEARAAAKIAEWNGKLGAQNGYDFGYCCPGSVRHVKQEAGEYTGLWEVCTF